jgi:lysophospholipase L1-like esterase
MKKLLLTILALIVLSSAVSAQSYQRAKLWDAEINSLTEIDQKQTAPKDSVLFVGNSSIRLWRSLRKDLPDINFINRGFGGSYLADVNYYFEHIITPYKPKQIVLYAGENDINDGKTPENVLADFKTFVSLVRKNFPKTKIYYISLKPSPSRWHLVNKFRETNNLIKTEITKDKNIIYVDVFNAMLNDKGEPQPELYVEDKLHLNEKGYAIWGNILKKGLR